MGKATIVKPKDRMFHNQEMPDGVLKVNMASVLEGFEDLPPPVPVDDDETPLRIGACKSWFLPWPKSLLHLEAPNNHTSTSMCEDHHLAYAIISSCTTG